MSEISEENKIKHIYNANKINIIAVMPFPSIFKINIYNPKSLSGRIYFRVGPYLYSDRTIYK